MIERVEVGLIDPIHQDNIEYLGRCLLSIQDKRNEEYISEIKEISKRFELIKELYIELEGIYGNKYSDMRIKKIDPDFEDWLEMVYNIFAAEFCKRTDNRYSDNIINFYISHYFEKYLVKPEGYKLKESAFEIFTKDGVGFFTEEEIISYLEEMLTSLES